MMESIVNTDIQIENSDARKIGYIEIFIDFGFDPILDKDLYDDNYETILNSKLVFGNYTFNFAKYFFKPINDIKKKLHYVFFKYFFSNYYEYENLRNIDKLKNDRMYNVEYLKFKFNSIKMFDKNIRYIFNNSDLDIKYSLSFNYYRYFIDPNEEFEHDYLVGEKKIVQGYIPFLERRIEEEAISLNNNSENLFLDICLEVKPIYYIIFVENDNFNFANKFNNLSKAELDVLKKFILTNTSYFEIKYF